MIIIGISLTVLLQYLTEVKQASIPGYCDSELSPHQERACGSIFG
jgi:hypothetical protein